MKLDELTRPENPMALTMVDSGDPLPILVAGETAGSLYFWTGNDDHLLRLEGAEYVETSGDQAELHGPAGEILGYIARADDVAEIEDLPTWSATMERLRDQTTEDSFNEWLLAEVAITK